MTWGCTTRGKTPAMIRADRHRLPSDPPGPVDPAARPALASGAGDGDGFAEWLAHVDAGRIAVR